MMALILFLLSSSFPTPTRGMADLTAAMFQARNLEELLEAEYQQRPDDGETPVQQRLRALQAQGLEDSEPILADHFDGEAGFYHGVASGKQTLGHREGCHDVILQVNPDTQCFVLCSFFRRSLEQRCHCLDTFHARSGQCYHHARASHGGRQCRTTGG